MQHMLLKAECRESGTERSDEHHSTVDELSGSACGKRNKATKSSYSMNAGTQNHFQRPRNKVLGLDLITQQCERRLAA